MTIKVILFCRFEGCSFPLLQNIRLDLFILIPLPSRASLQVPAGHSSTIYLDLFEMSANSRRAKQY